MFEKQRKCNLEGRGSTESRKGEPRKSSQAVFAQYCPLKTQTLNIHECSGVAAEKYAPFGIRCKIDQTWYHLKGNSIQD